MAYFFFSASESFFHWAPSSLPTSPKVILGFLATILARMALQKSM